MNVSLTPELEELVRQRVESGLYNNASEVVREALRALKDKDDRRKALTEELQRSIRTGIEQAARGETVSASEAQSRIQAIVDGSD